LIPQKKEGSYLIIQIIQFAKKIGIIYNLLDRAFLLSHPDFQQKNIELCVKLLLDNEYPLKLIFEKINMKLKKLITIINHNKIIVN